jgi:hypothetical protein
MRARFKREIIGIIPIQKILIKIINGKIKAITRESEERLSITTTHSFKKNFDESIDTSAIKLISPDISP